MQIFDFLGDEELSGDAFVSGGLAVSETYRPDVVASHRPLTQRERQRQAAAHKQEAARKKAAARARQAQAQAQKAKVKQPKVTAWPKLAQPTPPTRNMTFGSPADPPPGGTSEASANASGSQTQTVVVNAGSTNTVTTRGQSEAQAAKEAAKANLYAALAQAAQIATAKLAGGQTLNQTEAGSLAQYQQLQQLPPDQRRAALEHAVDKQDGDYSDVGGTAGWFLDGKKGFGFNISPVTIIVGVVGVVLFMQGQNSGRKGR